MRTKSKISSVFLCLFFWGGRVDIQLNTPLISPSPNCFFFEIFSVCLHSTTVFCILLTKQTKYNIWANPVTDPPLISPKAKNFFDLFHILFFFIGKLEGGVNCPLIFPKICSKGGGQLGGYGLTLLRVLQSFCFSSDQTLIVIRKKKSICQPFARVNLGGDNAPLPTTMILINFLPAAD